MAPSGAAFGNPVELTPAEFTAREFTVSSLMRYTLYRFVIQGYNVEGWGTESPSGFLRTLSDLPASPAGFVVSNVGFHSAVFTWQAPTLSPSYGGGPVIKYILERQVQSAWSEVERLPGSTTTFTPQNLEDGTTYVFRLKALNDAGESVPTAAAAPFQTSSDNTAPSIVSYYPLQASIENSVFVNVTLIFSEPIVLGNGTVTFKPKAGSSIVISITGGNGPGVKVHGNTMTIDLPGSLETGEMYAMMISANLIRDFATTPNFFPGVTSGAYEFRTTGATQPINPGGSEDDSNSLATLLFILVSAACACCFACLLCIYRKRAFAEEPEEPDGTKVVLYLESASMFTTLPAVTIPLPPSFEALKLAAKRKLRLRTVEGLFSAGIDIQSMSDLDEAVAVAKACGTRVVRVTVDGGDTSCCGRGKQGGEDRGAVAIHLNMENLGGSPSAEDNQRLTQYNVSDYSDGSTSTRSDAYNFRNVLGSHFAELNEEMGLKTVDEMAEADLEAVSTMALKISKEALEDAMARKNNAPTKGTSVTSRSDRGSNNAASGALPTAPNTSRGGAKSKLQEVLAAKRKAKAEKEAGLAGDGPGESSAAPCAEASAATGNPAAEAPKETEADRRKRLKQGLAARVKAKKAAKEAKA